MVRSTRMPSGMVCRFDSPWMRWDSNEGTSTTLRPILSARTFIIVSISKPVPSRASWGTTSRQKAL